jgi:hypothetical protein
MFCKKGKTNPVTGRVVPQGYATLRFPHFTDDRLTDGGEVVDLHAGRALLTGRFLVHIYVRGCGDPRA